MKVPESLMNRKLYVGNLPFQTTEADLEALFASAGDVASVTVMRDRETGRARGFAFVEMASDEGASAAVNTLNNTSYGGRNLSVNEARPQEARRDSFGGSRGGGGGGGRRSEPRW
jgi:cold-inducible RNA-binding protein